MSIGIPANNKVRNLRVERVARITLIGLLAGLIVAIVVLSSVPPVDRDALTHHLAVPKLYLANGGVFEIPWIVFSYYPMNLDMLYMIPLYFGNDIAPKFIHFAFALLTACLIYCYLKRRINSTYGLLGVLVFLSIPVIVKLSITVYVDLGLIFFSTAALLGIVRWADANFAWRHLVTSAIAAGLALGTKYNGLVVLFCTAMFVPWLYLRGGQPNARRQLESLGWGVLFVGIALLVFSPWMIRNYAWTGNPVYPLYSSVFNSAGGDSANGKETAETRSNPVEQDETVEVGKGKPLGHFTERRLIYGESGAEILSIPLRVFFEGRDDDPKYFDGQLNLALLLLPVVAALGWKGLSARDRREEQVLLGFSVAFLLVVFVQTDMRIRWISPIVPPLVLLSIQALRRMEVNLRSPESIARSAMIWVACIAGLLSFLWPGLVYVVRQFDVVRPVEFIKGDITRADYISRVRREYRVLEYANKELPKNAKILAFYLGNRTYYSDRFVDCSYSEFYQALDVARSSDDLVKFLQRGGYSHLLIRLDMFDHHLNYKLEKKMKGMLVNLFRRNLQLLHQADGYGLFAVFGGQNFGEVRLLE